MWDLLHVLSQGAMFRYSDGQLYVVAYTLLNNCVLAVGAETPLPAPVMLMQVTSDMYLKPDEIADWLKDYTRRAKEGEILSAAQVEAKKP